MFQISLFLLSQFKLYLETDRALKNVIREFLVVQFLTINEAKEGVEVSCAGLTF
jgi:hypothetical protein